MSAAEAHHVVWELLGAYALDAVEPEDTAVIEAHLSTCALCREELDAHRHAAALLGSLSDSPPEHLWSRVEQSLGPAEPPPFALRLPSATPAPRDKPRAPKRLLYLAGSVAASVLFFGGLALGAQRQDNPDRNATLALAERAAELPGARRVDLRSTQGQPLAAAVLLPDGRGYIVDNRLPDLPDGRTYQLWVFTADLTTPISAGILGGDFEAGAFTSATAIKALAVTEEASAGATLPTGTPVAIGTV